MKGRRKKRLVTGILCLAVLVADMVGPMGLQVMANEMGQERFAISVDSEKQNVDTDNKVGLIGGEDESANMENSTEDSGGGNDEQKSSEGDDGTGSESGAMEGNDGTGNENDSPETGDSVGSESGSAGDSDEKQEEDGTQGGESAPGETENAVDEDGEKTDIEEGGEDAVEETVSENTVVTSEELAEDAEAAMQGARVVTASGKCGDNLTWELVDGTLTISGTGEMYNYDRKADFITSAPWREYPDALKTLVLEEGIMTIGAHAFEGCSGFMGSLIIPKGVTSIENHAFERCSGFTGSLTIPKGVTSIGDDAFRGCSGFTGSLIIPEGVTSIGGYAFEGCSGFTGSLTIPEGVTNIISGTFNECSGFTGSLTIPEGVTKIGDMAFRECSGFTGNLVIPKGVTSIGWMAFYGCKGFAGSLTISEGLVSIGESAFANCSGFTGNLIIPNSVVEIGVRAYDGCNSFSGNLEIGNSVEKIGFSAFENCSSFVGSLTIPDSVIKIDFDAFRDCSGFTGNLKFGDNIKEIDSRAFANCSGFTGDLKIPDSVTYIGEMAFLDCSGFTGDLIIGNNVTEIRKSAFEGCCGFTGSFIIGDSITALNRNMFGIYGASPNFKGQLLIGNNVQTIGESMFYGVDFTGKLIIPDSVTCIENSAFKDCRGFTGDLKIPNNVEKLGNNAFSGCSGFDGKLTISRNITEIEAGVFKNCSGFTGNLTIPNNITSIGGDYWDGGAFEGCSKFTGSLEIPSTVTVIGDSAFKGCSGFTGNLIISDNVTSVGSSAFYGCNGFTGNLIIGNNVKSVGYSAFYKCSGFTGNLTIPNSVMNIDGAAFKDCTGFTGSLNIPKNVTSIGSDVFGPLTSSKKVYWHCTLNSTNDCINGGTVIYDDDVPEPTYLKRCTLIKRSDYEASEGDFPSDIQVPPDQAAVGAVDSSTGRLIRSAYIILDGQTYRTDMEGVYYFSLGQSGAVRRLVGATANGYLRANVVSMAVQHGKLTTVSMTKIVSNPAVGGDDVQIPAGKFAICVVDDNQKLIKNAAVEIDGDKIAAPDGVYYADADSKSHYVSASAKGYGGYISNPVTFQSGEKFSVFLRYNDDYNVTYQVGKLKSADVSTKKISLESSGECSTSDDFDFLKAASLLEKTVVLRKRDDVAMEIYTLAECAAVSVSIVPDTSSFIYQDGRFSTDSTAVHVSVYYTIRDGFPKNLANIMPQAEKPKFEMSSIRFTIDEGMKVRIGKEEGNALPLSVNRTMSIGEVYSFDISAILTSKAKPTQPTPFYKMAAEVSGSGYSVKGFQTFRVADADYKKEQTDKCPTTQGSDVSKESVAGLLDANIMFNIRGTYLAEQYFSEEQIEAVERMLTLWAANIEAATDTARKISDEEQFMMDVLEKLKVNINPYIYISGTTAQMRIKAKTKSYGERTFIFTLNLSNYSWDSQAPFGRLGDIKWRVEDTTDIPTPYQKGSCAFMVKPYADRFLLQLKELAYSSIKNAYKKTWGNKANKVAEMIVDKRILDIVNQQFGSVSDMCFKLMIEPTEVTIRKGGRKKSTTRCPVDLYVYDSQGNIAGAIIDDIAYPMDEGVLVYVEDGAKIVDYYADEYTVKFVGNDAGTMSHEVCEYYSTGEMIRQIEFKDIPLTDGKVYQETIPDYFFAPPEVYALEGEGQEMIHPDTDSYDEERPEIILVNGISVTPENVTLKIGEEKTLEAVITPAEASLQLVEWSSENENVVTVSEAGTIKAVGAGTAKVKAVSVDGRYEAECTVTVDQTGAVQPDDSEEPDKPGQGDVLDEDIPQGGIENIPKGLWISEVKPQAYTGKVIKPEVRVYDYKTLLQVKKDYTISYKNNTKANDAQTTKSAPTITVTGKGNYSGKEKQTFQILPKDITDDDIIVDDIALKANKKMQKPVPSVAWNGIKLVNKRDFSVSYTDATAGAYKDCGTYEILIFGTGNYSGSRRIVLTITESKPTAKLAVTKIADQIYTGKKLEPALVVKDGKTLLTKNVHYTVSYHNNVNVGTATVLLSGIGDYVGTKRITFKIKSVASLKNAKVLLLDANGQKYIGGTYNGGEIKPGGYSLTITVKGPDKKNTILTLKEGVDYQVSYSKHVQAGNASILFSGINGYTGSIKKTYKIKPYPFDSDQMQSGQVKVVMDQSYSYVKGGCKPKPVITFNGKELQEKTDYNLSYKYNTKLNSGDGISKIPTVIIKGKGNFSGTMAYTYAITQADISRLSLIAADKVWQNKGNNYKTKLAVKDVDNKVLAAGRDYDKNFVYTYHEDTRLADGTVKTAGTVISAKDIIPAGTVIEVSVHAKGANYYGTISGTYRIAKADISRAAVKIPAQIYTGRAIKPNDEIEVKLNGKVLSKENYEIVNYSNNINRGTASVTIRGKNDCGGTKTVKFTIRSKGFLWWWR